MPLKSANPPLTLPGTDKRARGFLGRFPPANQELAGQITLLRRQGCIPRFEIWRFDVMLYSMTGCWSLLMEKREFGR